MTPFLSELTALVVTAANEELCTRFAEPGREIKEDGSWVTEADKAMQARMARELARRWPEYGLLSEEMSGAEQEEVLVASRGGLWCLDPLDGTTNFTHGLPFYAVSLALIDRGRIAAGIVYDPARQECFVAEKSRGAWRNGHRLAGAQTPPLALRRSVGVVDFKRLAPRLASRLGQDPPYGSQRHFGACALDWCWLAAGRFEVYLHGGQKLWDYAAGSLILAEAGGHQCTLEGEPVFSGDLAPRSVVAALHPELFQAFRSWIAIPP
ncbi:MAG: inositol monophosphatase family protein [Acidiferrobacteraceae bacterium]